MARYAEKLHIVPVFAPASSTTTIRSYAVALDNSEWITFLIKCPITVACMKRNGLEALNFQHKMNYNRNTNFEYTTETIMFYTRC